MMDDSHLDGNSLGGTLSEIFGRDVTADLGSCAQCGANKPIGATIVYRNAPGDVMRCPDCLSVLIVIVPTPSGHRISFGSLAWIEAT
jgi:Family of unknown function (DUF6510)